MEGACRALFHDTLPWQNDFLLVCETAVVIEGLELDPLWRVPVGLGTEVEVTLLVRHKAGRGEETSPANRIESRLLKTISFGERFIFAIQCNLSIPNLVYSEILFNPNKLFGPNIFYYLLHIKSPYVFWILYIPNSEHKIKSLEYIIA